jgi:GNAT superfamily N-acetyltransferase
MTAAMSATGASLARPCSGGRYPGGPLPVHGGEAGGVRVRRAEAADRAALSAMFDRCTPSTRYRRFHGPVKAIPERYLADALSGSPFHYALVACPEPVPGPGPEPDPCQRRKPGGGGIVALASCRTVDEGAAELGVLIEDAWQRRGLGTRLVRDLAAHASRTGLRTLGAQLLAEQAWITGLLRPYGPCRLTSTWTGILNVTVRLGPSAQGSKGPGQWNHDSVLDYPKA